MVPEAGPYESVARHLDGSPFAAIRYVEETESTNDDAASLLSEERYGGLTIVAEYQRRGSGRKGRRWEAPAGTSLLCTTILPGSIAARNLWLVPYWAALAICDALSELNVSTVLQWPNDVLCGQRKIAGILCQSSVAGSVARVACGVGINVHRFATANDAIEPAPAFCDDVAALERPEMLRALLLSYESSLPSLHQPELVTQRWNDAAQLPGRRYRIAPDSGMPFDAIALGLATGGGLRVQRKSGERETIALADARIER